MTRDPNRNARWTRLISEELQRGGVAHVVLCPGSRNSPLVFALATAFGTAAISHVDERSAGFIALGLIRSTGKPAVVCVTSGSALANLLPAVVEADAAGLPLLVISADRPWEAHDCGAQQTLQQRRIFGNFLRAEVDLGEPLDDDRALRAVRSRVSRLARTSDGPTHLNVPLRDPLPPVPDPTWHPGQVSLEAEQGRTAGFTIGVAPAIAAPLAREPWMRPGMRGLIVVGCPAELGDLLPAVIALAQTTGFPVWADGPSGVRDPAVPQLITTHDALVSGPLATSEPEVILQIGQIPLTRAAYEWLDRQRCPWITLGAGRNLDALGRSWLNLGQGWSGAVPQLAEWLAPGDAAWAAQWTTAEATARNTLSSRTAALGWSESLAVHRALHQPGFAFVHLASSMAIRHANLHLPPTSRAVHSNRGVNGIDGTLGTFLGLARGHGARGLLLIGDLAFLHDLPALAAAGLGRGAIVLLNNGGGGIFDFLPVAQVPGYRQLIRTSHERTFGAAADLFGLVYHACRQESELAAALDAASHGDGLHLIECHLSGLDPVIQHRALIRACSGVDVNDRPA
jgi:2-succinyl-5-enolpyruvyl-6-hydroxy-3-cyclohexene-1-carboxylate synthase